MSFTNAVSPPTYPPPHTYTPRSNSAIIALSNITVRFTLKHFPSHWEWLAIILIILSFPPNRSEYPLRGMMHLTKDLCLGIEKAVSDFMLRICRPNEALEAFHSQKTSVSWKSPSKQCLPIKLSCKYAGVMLASRADILLAGQADIPSQQTAASTISHFHSWRWLNYWLFYNFWFNRTLISSLFTMCYKMSCIPLLSPQTLHQIICIQALINAHQTEATICKEGDGCFG